MKQNVLRVPVLFCAITMMMCWSTLSNAKKIKYSDQIVYDGKVDANGLPHGEGKLITTYGEYKDVLEGIFNNNTVTSATLKLKIYDKKLFHFCYTGTVEYTIAENVSSVSYKLTDGSFTADITSDNSFYYKSEYPEIKAQESFTITEGASLNIFNILQGGRNSFDVSDITKSYEVSNPQKELASIKDILKLVSSNNIGNILSAKRIISFRFNTSNFHLYPQPDAQKELTFDNGTIVKATKNTINCMYTNGDFCKIDKVSNTSSFKKTLSDGVLSKDISSKLIMFDGKEKNAATTISGIDDVASFMDCKTIEDAQKLYIFYFDSLRDALIKSVDGDATAMFQLGKAFYEGDGIAMDHRRGKAWLKDAILKGSEAAKNYCLESNIKIIVSDSRSADNTYIYNYLDGDKVVKDGEYLYNGTSYHMNNGLLEVKNGKMYFTIKDSLSFVGYFKEQRSGEGFLAMVNDADLLNNDELTPWYGTVTYADGNSEEITEGIKPKSVPVGRIKQIDDALALLKGTRFLDSNHKVTLPLDIIGSINDRSSSGFLGDPNATATIEVTSFGQEGNTIFMTLDIPSIKQNHTFNWSGKTVHLLPGYDDDGISASFAILRGMTVCGTVTCMKDSQGKIIWIGMVNKSNDVVPTDFLKKGMTIAQVQDIWTQLNYCQFKFTRNTASGSVYSAYWLDMTKQYNIFGDYKYVMRNDKKYGDFYFDKNGKLVKWLLYI